MSVAIHRGVTLRFPAMRQSWGFCLVLLLGLDACSTARRGGDGDTDAGSNHNQTDAKAPPSPDAAVGVNASALTFAIVGDVRPAIPEDTANYPTAIITKI